METIQDSKLRPYTDATITNLETLQQSVSLAKRDGFARIEQSFELEVSSIAMPFYENSNFAYGTIAIAVPSSRMETLDTNRLVQLLSATAEKITIEQASQLLGEKEKRSTEEPAGR